MSPPDGSDPEPTGDDPFGGIPFLGDIAKMFGGGDGPISWDVARQVAIAVATGGSSEPNPSPTTRMELEQLVRVAELQVAKISGLTTSSGGAPLTVRTVTRAQWATATLEAWRDLLAELATALGRTAFGDGEGPFGGDDPSSMDPLASGEQMMAGLMKMLGPAMFGMQAGTMVGHLSSRAFGQYDLPVPRPGDELLVIAPNVDSFAEEWSLPAADIHLWICLHEVAHHAVIRRPHVAERLTDLMTRYAGSFEPDPTAIEDRMGSIDPTDQSAMQRLFADPSFLLGAIESPRSREIRPQLDALTSAIVGYVDWILDEVGPGLMSSYGALTEALRRRRVVTSEADRFTERMFGLDLGQTHYERGEAFVAGVAERAGGDGVNRLWERVENLPTPAEIDAPGLWLARIDLPDDD